jgi:hypothetical protein
MRWPSSVSTRVGRSSYWALDQRVDVVHEPHVGERELVLIASWARRPISKRVTSTSGQGRRTVEEVGLEVSG